MWRYRLTFLLPAGLAGAVRRGALRSGELRCTIDGGLVRIDGPSRERVFDYAATFLRVVTEGHAPMVIAAILWTPDPGQGRGRDSYQIVIGSDVTFAPGGIEPHIVGMDHAPA